MPKGIFEVPVEKVLLDLLHEGRKPGVEVGSEAVPEDIQQELLQRKGHLLGWERSSSLQRLRDGHGILWLKRLLMMGRCVPRRHTVHEPATSTMGFPDGSIIRIKMGGVDGDARSFQILDGGEVLTSKLGLAVDPIPCMHLGSGSPISSTSTDCSHQINVLYPISVVASCQAIMQRYSDFFCIRVLVQPMQGPDSRGGTPLKPISRASSHHSWRMRETGGG